MYGGSPYRGSTGGNQSLKGTGYRQISSPQFTQEQMGLFKQLFSGMGNESQLGQLAGGDQSQFDQLEAPALKQFGALQGGLASRFSGMGGLGARNSSGFQNTANAAAQDFAGQLQSQRLGIQNQARNDLFSMSQQLLGQRPFEDIFVPKQQKNPSFWSSLLGGLGGAATQAGSTLGTMYGANKLGLFGRNQQQQPIM